MLLPADGRRIDVGRVRGRKVRIVRGSGGYLYHLLAVDNKKATSQGQRISSAFAT